MTFTPERAMERMGKLMLALGGAGVIALLVWRGWTWSLGWVLGCTASMLNFHWLRRVTDSLGSGTAKDRKAVLLGLRYLLLGGGAYVILKYTAISLPAALAGLFVPVAAVIIEILIELMYART
ncbi:MAG TPA: ATP synthase subunit I [Candidatus Acidoferrum sp.]|nr:ATP synthase subunit I [Candidatus Acidoferrum sp.]